MKRRNQIAKLELPRRDSTLTWITNHLTKTTRLFHLLISLISAGKLMSASFKHTMQIMESIVKALKLNN